MVKIFKAIILRGKKLKRLLLFVLAVLLIYTVGQKTGVLQKAVSVVASGKRLVPIYYVDTQEQKIAVSFDASWGAERTPRLLEILRAENIKTTFFLTGYWIEKYPEQVKEIAAEGHEIGNHTYSHPHLNSLGEAEIGKEIDRVHEMIKELTQKEPDLFRPPFGEYSNKVIKVLNDKNYKSIQWSIDSLDWQDLSTEEIINRVVGQLHPGAIVLFHNNGENTPDALPVIIELAQEKGYKIVPISELLYKDNYYIDSNTGAQVKKP